MIVAELHEPSPASLVSNQAYFAAVINYVQSIFGSGNPAEERFHVIFLDQGHRYICDNVMACGSAVHLPVRLRDLFARALQIEARAIIVAHNHPSGDCRPSTNDISATRRLREIGQALDIDLLDHLIITREKVYSMRAGGKL